MNQSSCVKTLQFSKEFENIPFLSFPGAKNCLKGLSAFNFHSDISSDFFDQLSQICHDIQTLTIILKDGIISNELKEFISSQNNLKRLELINQGYKSWSSFVHTLAKHGNTLEKLYVKPWCSDSLSFIASFKNLQELFIVTDNPRFFNDFKLRSVVTFPN